MITGQNNKIICSIFYALNSNLKSRLFMQCSGIILKITTDLHLVLILLCQVRPFATRRLVKEDNGRPVRRIYSTGTIGWQNSALDRRKFYDIKLFNYNCNIFIANISWTVAHTPINHIIFWKTVIRNFRCMHVNCCNRIRFLAGVSTKLQKHTFFNNWEPNSGRKHGN